MSTRGGNKVPKNVVRALREDLLQWICEKHATNSAVDRQLLRRKAMQLADAYGLIEFKCSDAWVTSFLKKHGFSPQLSNCSGPTFDDYHQWIDLMRSTITSYKHRDLFHADELTMLTNVPPDRMTYDEISTNLRINESRTEDGEEERSAQWKHWVTVLMCCNSTGNEKLPLLVTGSYEAELRIETDHLYEGCCQPDRKDQLFRDWLKKFDERMSSCGRQILLLLHRKRIRSMRNLQLNSIQPIFFPRDFPAALRPLRRDVFHYIKMIYRRRYVERATASSGDWTLQETLNTLIDIWKNLPIELVTASFQRTKFRTDDCLVQIRCEEWKNSHRGLSFKTYVTFDDDLSENSVDNLEQQDNNARHEYYLRTSRPESANSINHFDVDLTIDEKQENNDEECVHRRTESEKGISKINPSHEEETQLFSTSSRCYQQDQDIDMTDRTDLSGSLEQNDDTTNHCESSDGLIVFHEVRTFMEDLMDSLEIELTKDHEDTTRKRTQDEYFRKLFGRVYVSKRARRNECSSESYLRNSSRRSSGCSAEIKKNLTPENCSNATAKMTNESHSFYRAIDSNLSSLIDFSRAGNSSENNIQGTLEDRNLESNLEASKLDGSSIDDRSTKYCNKKRARSVDPCDNLEKDEFGPNQEPAEKRTKLDYNWSKYYENRFVFGSSDRDRPVQSSNHDSTNESIRMSTNKTQNTQTRNTDLERSIFTICGKATTPQFPPTE